MNATDTLARAAARDGRHYYPHPPVTETAMVHGLTLLVHKREDQIAELEATIERAWRALKQAPREVPYHQQRLDARKILEEVKR